MVLAHNIYAGRRTKDIQITQDVTFESMLLAPNTLEGLKDSGFYKPSPVQLHGIPLGKCGFDLLLEAKSGTGKTAVFTIVALEKLDLKVGVQVIILAPTREIAAQIFNVIKHIGIKYKGLVVEVVMGGLPLEEDIKKFKKNVHIVVGSPGRLRYLIQDKHINTSFVRLFVLDEADKLMEKSFQADINYIFSLLPDQKQVILSSATYSESTKSFVSKYVKNAQHICPDNNAILLGIKQNITTVKFNANIVRQTQYRFEELIKILSNKAFKQCLIFCNYQARVTELYKLLSKHRWPVKQLYGQQDQTDRLEALKTLQNYKCRILISTDLAARGIDASNVDLVINFEPPYEWQTYLHRIGRAGRYGLYGIAITILSEGKEEQKFKKMLQTMNVPLNINIFGSNDKTNIDVDSNLQVKTSLITNGSMDSPYVDVKEIWKEFTNCSSLDMGEIECFEKLCESYQVTVKPNFESFDDLLKSYDRDTPLKNEDKYRHMKIAPETLKDLSTLSCQIKTSNNGIIIEKNMDSKQLSQKNDDDLKNVIIKDQDDYYVTKKSKQASLEITTINNDTINSNNLTDCRKKSQSDALLEANLPVAFVSKKDVRRIQLNQLRKEKNKSNVIAKQIIEKEKHKYCQNNTNTFNGFRAKEKPVFCETKIKSEGKISHKHISKSDSYKYDRNDKINCLRNFENVRADYVNWFKQLKLRVNQIAYVLYMNEMSRIQYN